MNIAKEFERLAQEQKEVIIKASDGGDLINGVARGYDPDNGFFVVLQSFEDIRKKGRDVQDTLIYLPLSSIVYISTKA
ncbi:hypothetical protein [Brevibacillus centrosporus]|uniref:hypothetical protein n=1 Tax=Brevibacillus centrosporus TaxID=54910 RepID=UPI002E234F07|nr:hypothetical protein [Brevibacillus centrosporus]